MCLNIDFYKKYIHVLKYIQMFIIKIYFSTLNVCYTILYNNLEIFYFEQLKLSIFLLLNRINCLIIIIQYHR